MSVSSSSSGSRDGRWRLWPWAVLLGLVLRIAAAVATPVFPTVANTWDSHFYHESAAAMARGEGYTFQGHPTALYPPGYAAALSVAYRVAGTRPRAGQALNILASLWLLAAAAWIAGELGGRGVARRTAVVLALEPSQIVMPAFLMSEVVCAAVAATALAALVRFARRGTGGWLWGAALAAAYAGMTRGHALLVAPAAALAFWAGARRAQSRVVVMVAVLLVVEGATVALWAARNQRVLGHPVPVATNAGMNLLLGNNPNAWGARADPPGGVPQTGDEVRDERLATARARRYIETHPLRFVALLPVKAVRLLAVAPALTYRAELIRKWGRPAAWFVLVLAQLAHLAAWWLAAAFVFRRRKEPRSVSERTLIGIVGLVIGVWTLAHLPFLGGARYFFPVQFLLWILAAYSLWSAPLADNERSTGS